MKRSQIILFAVFIVLTGIIYLTLSSNQKEYSKKTKTEKETVFVPVSKVANKMRHMEIISYGQITPSTELLVSFEIQGKLIKGNKTLKPGVKFSKGEMLFKVDNEEAFYSLSARKTNLANLVLTALPDIELDFPKEKNKWSNFMDDLDPGKLLPDFPTINSKKERMFLTSRNILSEFYNLKSTEARMEKYFYIAPFSGTVIEIYSEPGSIVNPGGQVAKIAKTGDFEIKVPIDLEDVDLYKSKNSAQFTNPKGEIVGAGKIIRISDFINQQTQSADVYFSITPVKGHKIYHGLFVNVKINKEAEKETMSLPRVAVKNGKVNVLKDQKIIPMDVLVVGQKPDTVFVTGLEDGLKVVLESVEQTREKVVFEGIER